MSGPGTFPSASHSANMPGITGLQTPREVPVWGTSTDAITSGRIPECQVSFFRDQLSCLGGLNSHALFLVSLLIPRCDGH